MIVRYKLGDEWLQADISQVLFDHFETLRTCVEECSYQGNIITIDENLNVDVPIMCRHFRPQYYQYFPPFDPSIDYFGQYLEAMAILLEDFNRIADYHVSLIERWYWYSDYLNMEYFISNVEKYYEEQQKGKSYEDWLQFFGIEAANILSEDEQKNIYLRLKN